MLLRFEFPLGPDDMTWSMQIKGEFLFGWVGNFYFVQISTFSHGSNHGVAVVMRAGNAVFRSSCFSFFLLLFSLQKDYWKLSYKYLGGFTPELSSFGPHILLNLCKQSCLDLFSSLVFALCMAGYRAIGCDVQSIYLIWFARLSIMALLLSWQTILELVRVQVPHELLIKSHLRPVSVCSGHTVARQAGR